MPNLYDIDFNLQTENLLNPLHRAQENLDYIGSIAADIQYSRDNILGNYKEGAVYPAYSNAVNYVAGDRVIFTDKGVYENLVPCVGVDPSGNILSTTNWRKLQDNYLGVDTRKMYNGQIIVLVKALNEWFNVTSSPYIYLVNNNFPGLGFDLYIPLAVYNGIASTNPDRDTAIRQFTDKYAIAGIVFQINTY